MIFLYSISIFNLDKDIMDFLINLFFPKECYFCRKEGRYLCTDCITNYLKINWEQKCYVCGKTCSKGMVHIECAEKGYLDGLLYFALYDKKTQEIIKDIKYKFYFDILKELAEIMSEYLRTYKFSPDLILADVPLHNRKKLFRGFNQSEVLAKEIAFRKGFKYKSLLKRIEDTKTQVGMNREERENNLRTAFKVINSEIPKEVLLVDDIYTTGSTLNQCAKVLKEAGAEKVYGYVFAKSRE